jgi:hypothetical protein
VKPGKISNGRERAVCGKNCPASPLNFGSCRLVRAAQVFQKFMKKGNAFLVISSIE